MTSIGIEVTKDTLTDADIVLVRVTIAELQVQLSRKNIPGTAIYQILKGKFALPLDETSFRLALSKAVTAGRVPGIAGHVGKTGGFGPVKESKESNVSNSNSPPAVIPTSERVVVQKVAELPVETVTPVVNPPVEEAPRVVEKKTPAFDTIPTIEDLQAVVAQVPTIPEANRPVVVQEPIKVGNWDPERARGFILAFADAANRDEAKLLRLRVDEACKSATTTRALIRVAMGWDPAKIRSGYILWQDLFVEEVEAEDKIEEENTKEAKSA